MENDGPEPGSQPVAVAEITATPAQAQQGKKQLSEAQKAGLAKAREKAREKKLAASKQKSDMEKADAEKEEDERKKAQAYIHSQIAEQSAAAKAALEQEEAKEKPISDDDMATPSDAYTRLKRSAFHSIFTPDEQRLRTTQRVSSHLDVALPILLLGLVVHLRCSSEPTIQIIRNGCQYAEISSQIGMDRVQTGRRSFVGDDSLLCSCVIEHGSALL